MAHGAADGTLHDDTRALAALTRAGPYCPACTPDRGHDHPAQNVARLVRSDGRLQDASALLPVDNVVAG